MRRLPLILAAIALLPAAACSDRKPAQDSAAEPVSQPAAGPDAPDGIALSDATIRLPAVPGRPGAAYFTIRSGDEPATIVSVAVTGAGRTEMHETTMTDGVSMMAAADSIALAANETLSFAPGGLHVMLFDLDGSLAAGGSADLTVVFESGDKVSASAKVLAPGAQMEMKH